MYERPELPIQEPHQPDFLTAVSQDSPEFQEMKQVVREEMKARGKLPDEKTLIWLTNLRFIPRGMAAEQQKREEERKANRRQQV